MTAPVPIALPEKAPRWCVAMGAWGDTFAAVGNMLAALRATGCVETGVIHYGFDPAIAEWLLCQPWVREAINICPHSWPEYLEIVRGANCPDTPHASWMGRVLEGQAIRLDEVWHTCVFFGDPHHWRPEFWHGAQLPPRCRQRAQEIVEGSRQHGGRAYLLNPRSEQSTQWNGHWPHWYEAIEWLLAETEHTYLLTGQSWEPPWESPHLVNLIGETHTNMDVLALAEASDGMITTSNNLSMWSVIQDIPAIVCHNASMPGNPYFPLWVEHAPNRVIQYGDSLAQFQRRVRTWMM